MLVFMSSVRFYTVPNIIAILLMTYISLFGILLSKGGYDMLCIASSPCKV